MVFLDRAVGAAAVVVLALAALSGCAPTPPQVPGSVEVEAGTDAKLSVDGVMVEIPGESLSGAGSLVVRVSEQEGREGWEIELTGGATLIGPATLTFVRTPQEGEPPPIVMSSTAGGELTPAESVTVTEGGAEVVTTHFSFWRVTWWSDLAEPIKKIWNAVFSGGSDDAKLNCQGAAGVQAAGYRVTGPDSDERASWCAGVADGRPELQVKNERAYPMLAEASVGLAQQGADESFEMLVAQLFTILGEGPTKNGASIYPLLSKDDARYLVANSTPQSVTLSSNPSAYTAQVLRFAVDTAMQFPKLLGKTVSSKVLMNAIQSGDCIRGFGQLAGANPQSVDAVMGYLDAGISAAFSCVGDVMKQVFKSDALLISVATGIAWIGKGANLVGSAAQAVGDMVSNIGNPYKVIISGIDRWLVTSDGIGPLTLGTPYEDLEPLIPAGNMPCIPYAEESWSAHVWGSGNANYMFVVSNRWPLPAEVSADAPMTEHGVTIGTPEADLIALGYSKKALQWSPDYFEYTWQEDGVPFVASLDESGRVNIIGVGTDYTPIEFCA